jgi:hypothetical protein
MPVRDIANLVVLQDEVKAVCGHLQLSCHSLVVLAANILLLVCIGGCKGVAHGAERCCLALKHAEHLFLRCFGRCLAPSLCLRV